MNAKTVDVNVTTQVKDAPKEDHSKQFEAIKELADIELAYVGGGTAQVIFV